MNNNTDYIKSSVTMPQVLEMYGFNANRAGFISCPFHSEKTASLRIYPNSFYCFGCGEGGDVIKFVMLMEGCDFQTALERLGGKSEMPWKEKRKISEAKQRQIKLQQEMERNKNEYHMLFDEWARLDKNLMKYEPTDPNEPLHPLYVEALHKIEYRGYLLDNFTKEW